MNEGEEEAGRRGMNAFLSDLTAASEAEFGMLESKSPEVVRVEHKRRVNKACFQCRGIRLQGNTMK